MARLDPGLMLLSRSDGEPSRWQRESLFSIERDPDHEERVRVLLHFDGERTALEAVGVRVFAQLGPILAADVPRHRILELERVEGLRRAEAARRTSRELDEVGRAIGIGAMHDATPPQRGAGVVVAVIDSGIEFRHPAFVRGSGSESTTRITSIWDQGLDPVPGEQSPPGFGYGVEYDAATITACVRNQPDAPLVRHRDVARDAHGTMVAGIAAGNGQPFDPASGLPHCVGMAPEADLLIVAYTRRHDERERGVGDCCDLIAAFAYIAEKVNNGPVVINCSIGETLGPHDGTSLVEQAMESLAQRPGVVIVKSAGNEVGHGRHATQVLQGGEPQTVVFRVGQPTKEVVLDLWYEGERAIDVTVVAPSLIELRVPPGGTVETWTATTRLAGHSEREAPENGHKRVFLHLSSETTVEHGDWKLRLGGDMSPGVRWHAWLARDCGAQFLPPHESDDFTISVPGTGASVITVGAHEVRGARSGKLYPRSSRGPTRDGRSAPTLTAPGARILAPAPVAGRFEFMEANGTSMAAAVVTGVVALLLSARPTASAAEVRACLVGSARRPRLSPSQSGNGWGAGQLRSGDAWSHWTAPDRS